MLCPVSGPLDLLCALLPLFPLPTEQHGSTPLHAAAFYGHKDCCMVCKHDVNGVACGHFRLYSLGHMRTYYCVCRRPCYRGRRTRVSGTDSASPHSTNYVCIRKCILLEHSISGECVDIRDYSSILCRSKSARFPQKIKHELELLFRAALMND